MDGADDIPPPGARTCRDSNRKTHILEKPPASGTYRDIYGRLGIPLRPPIRLMKPRGPGCRGGHVTRGYMGYRIPPGPHQRPRWGPISSLPGEKLRYGMRAPESRKMRKAPKTRGFRGFLITLHIAGERRGRRMKPRSAQLEEPCVSQKIFKNFVQFSSFVAFSLFSRAESESDVKT